MDLNPLSVGLGLIDSIIKRVWPDKTEQERARFAAAMAADEHLTQLLVGQLKINENEAANPNLFVSGWRPSVGWVCSLAFAWQFLFLPIFLFIGQATGHPFSAPVFDISTMVTVLMGLLGMGTLRTYEKIKGLS